MHVVYNGGFQLWVHFEIPDFRDLRAQFETLVKSLLKPEWGQRWGSVSVDHNTALYTQTQEITQIHFWQTNIHCNGMRKLVESFIKCVCDSAAVCCWGVKRQWSVTGWGKVTQISDDSAQTHLLNHTDSQSQWGICLSGNRTDINALHLLKLCLCRIY